MSLSQEDNDRMRDWLSQKPRGMEMRLVAGLHKLISPNLRDASHSAVMRMLELESAAMHACDLCPGVRSRQESRRKFN